MARGRGRRKRVKLESSNVTVQKSYAENDQDSDVSVAAVMRPDTSTTNGSKDQDSGNAANESDTCPQCLKTFKSSLGLKYHIGKLFGCLLHVAYGRHNIICKTTQSLLRPPHRAKSVPALLGKKC